MGLWKIYLLLFVFIIVFGIIAVLYKKAFGKELNVRAFF